MMRPFHLAVLLAGCQATGAPEAAPGRPQTVSVVLGADSDAVAQRECGGAARPETVSHESNVVIYRCLEAR